MNILDPIYPHLDLKPSLGGWNPKSYLRRAVHEIWKGILRENPTYGLVNFEDINTWRGGDYDIKSLQGILKEI